MTAGQAMTRKAPASGGRLCLDSSEWWIAFVRTAARIAGEKLFVWDGYDEEPAPASASSSPEVPVL